jgi:hypothetical protein
MRRQTGHPDTEALANFRAGLVSGISRRRIAAHIARCERCAQLSDQLSAVTQALASAPAPSLPDAIERRIGASIAAEAVARQAASLAADSMADLSAGPLVPARQAVRSAANGSGPERCAANGSGAARSAANGSPARPYPSPPSSSPRSRSPRRALGAAGARLRLSPARMLVPVAACLLLAGLGYLLSLPGAAGMPSSAGPNPTSGSVFASRSTATPGNASVSRGPHRDMIGPSGGNGPVSNRSGALFLVTVSAIRYRKSTLRAQVSSQLAARDSVPGISPAPAVTSTPGSDNSGENSSTTGLVPSTSLVGCVMNLTSHVTPAFVQRATYQAMPAYVIAVPDEAWVVGLSCTAAKPALITSITLVPAG